MATKTLIVCDLEESKEREAETVSFKVDGTAYTIDLCPKHRAKLEEAMEPFRERARRVRPGPARPASTKRSGGRAAAIRQWAAESGIRVSPNGRIAAHVQAQYDAEKGRAQ
jgi:hypothetical protein